MAQREKIPCCLNETDEVFDSLRETKMEMEVEGGKEDRIKRRMEEDGGMKSMFDFNVSYSFITSKAEHANSCRERKHAEFDMQNLT